MKRTRVILFVGSLQIGGTERNVLHIARSLDREMFEVEVWCNYGGQPLERAIREAGVPCRSLKEVSLGQPPLARLLRHNLPYQWKLWNLLRRNRGAVVHVFGFPMTYYVVFLGALAGARRILFCIQDCDVWKKGPAYRMLDWAASRLARRIVANGEGVARFAAKNLGMAPDKFEVLYDGVDATELRPARPRRATRRELGATGEDVLATVVARLDVRKKGQDVAIQAARILAGASPRVKMAFVGDGPDRALLERMASPLPPDARPLFAGFRSDLADVLHASDLVLIPSRWEGMPKVMLEAMWLKRPVVVTRVGNMPELADERTGRLIDPDDPEGLASAVAELAADPGLRRRLGEAGRSRLEERGLTLDQSVKRLEAIYERAAVGRSAPARGS